MLGKLILAVAVLGLFAGWAGSARAEDATAARDHYERGTKFYDIGRYDEAIREFEAAYEAKSDPAFIYNLAQAHRLAGHNQEALQLYRNYLRYVPHPPNRADIDERIRGLEKAAAERPSNPPAPSPGQPVTPGPGTTPPAPATVSPPPPSPTYPAPAGPAAPEPQAAGAQPAYPVRPSEGAGVSAPPQQPPPPVTPDYGVAPQPPPAAAARSSRKTAGIVIAAIGGAFLVGGAVSGAIAWSSSRSVEKAADNGDAFDPSVESTGRAAAVLQWVGYGIGAAGLAVGLILVATSPSTHEGTPPPIAALPLVGPGLGGAAVRMTF